jgi:predicted deacylase
MKTIEEQRLIMNKRIESKTFRAFNGREFKVSYATIEGEKPGPTLTLIAGQHGMEHMGPVALKDFVNEIAGLEFCGTLNICPCANPLALELDYEFYPEKEDLSKLNNYYYSRFRHDYCIFGMERSKGPNWYNMNRLWNRQEIYGVAGEITHWLWNEIVKNANVTIDFHCLQADKPLIFNWDKDSVDVARYFGIEAIFPQHSTDDFNKGNLAYQASCGNQYGFCVEFSIQHGYKGEFDIARTGILNVMKGIGMLAGDIILERPVYCIKEWHQLQTDKLGHIHYKFEEYDKVKKGDLVCEISSLQNFEIIDRLYSPVDGIMGRRNHAPLSGRGITLTQINEVDVVAEAGANLPKID